MEPELIYRLSGLTRHIDLVKTSANVLGNRIIASGDFCLGKALIASAYGHDLSKFHGIEWQYLYPGADQALLTIARDHHVSTNTHHPEYWGDIKEMPTVALAEMVCDWHARSSEAGTDLRAWVRDEACDRWKISRKTVAYREIKKFIDTLLDPEMHRLGG